VLIHLSAEVALLASRTDGSKGGEMGRAVVLAGGAVLIAW